MKLCTLRAPGSGALWSQLRLHEIIGITLIRQIPKPLERNTVRFSEATAGPSTRGAVDPLLGAIQFTLLTLRLLSLYSFTNEDNIRL